MLKVNPSEKKSTRCQMYANSEDHIETLFQFPCTDSRHNGKCNICAFHEEIHAFEDWIFVSLSSLVLASEWTTNLKQVYCLIDRCMTSECSYTLVLPFTSKTGQSVEQNRKRVFNLGFTSKERTYFRIL